MPNQNGDMQYRGLSNHIGGRKIADAEYVKMGKRNVRKLSAKEIKEWHERLTGVVRLNTQRRAIV